MRKARCARIRALGRRAFSVVMAGLLVATMMPLSLAAYADSDTPETSGDKTPDFPNGGGQLIL